MTRLQMRLLIVVRPKPNRHWTDDEVASRCLTYWEQWNGRRERCESWRRSLFGGLVVAGLITAVVFVGFAL
jgi:hypothetical protein